MKIVLLSTLLFCYALNAQNLLPNASFDNNVDGWSSEYREVIWDRSDGASANGCLQISSNVNNGGSGATSPDKIPVIANNLYKVKGMTKPLSDSETSGAVIFIDWYNNEDIKIGKSDFIYVPIATANNQWTAFEEIIESPTEAKYAKYHIAVGTNNTGSTQPSRVKYDDLRFELTSDNPNAFAMVSGHSALWYNPTQSGHGINTYMLADQRVIVIWYVYDDFGKPLWLLGVGTHDGFKAILDVTITSGAMFPPDFNPNDVVRADWGKFELEFTGCNNGNFKWMPNEENGFSAGEMSVQRLNTTLGLTCSE